MTLLDTVRRHWREFKAGKPGHRFQDLNERRQRDPRARLKKGLYLGGGVAVVALGILSYPIPLIPSEIVILLGVALFAQGSRSGARALDWLELRLRGPFLWVYRKLWKPAPKWVRVLLSIAWMVLLALAGYGLTRLFRG